jgi:hypothetical protein
MEVIAELCAPDVVLIGTDTNERWQGRDAVLESLAGAFDLDAQWSSPPIIRDSWLFAEVAFTDGVGSTVHARVTMVFRGGLLAHAHYSVPAA